jgi:2,4-dienoyl-CoA reductase-like NADH-dependent reductase (Old Yellow Enzyme family)
VSAIFETTRIGQLELKNRLVRSATWDGMADTDGGVTGQMIELYQDVADGGVGLIISGYMFVSPTGRQWPTQLGAHRDELVPGLEEIPKAVHGRGGSIVAQIVHTGGQALPDSTFGEGAVAPSAVDSPGYPSMPRELTTAEVEQIVADFAAAAGRVQQAGFDGVQLHGAHGYLMAQFLSPSRNLRSDRFGGSLENRARFGLQVYRAVREEVGDSYPVMIKLNAHDFLDGSTTEEDSCHFARSLAAEGIDAIEVSGGTGGSGKLGAARGDIDTPEDEAYFLPQARAIRAAVPDVPLMLVGGMRSLGRMEAILAAGEADYFAICRPLIREPDLPQRWRDGDRRRADCISCRGCFKPTMRGNGVKCVQLGQQD